MSHPEGVNEIACGKEPESTTLGDLAAQATADEMHDLQMVAFAEYGRSPGITSDNVAVQFDSNAVGLDAELLDQRG